MFSFIMIHYIGLVIIAFITFALTILLRTPIAILLQVVLLVLMYFVQTDMLAILFAIAQVLFTVTVLYKVFRAIHYNYELVVEKTHIVERNYTKLEFSGVRTSFWNGK